MHGLIVVSGFRGTTSIFDQQIRNSEVLPLLNLHGSSYLTIVSHNECLLKLVIPFDVFIQNLIDPIIMKLRHVFVLVLLVAANLYQVV